MHSPEKKLVQFGAGNIGRSFLGQLFGRAGYEVVFVDVDSELVDALNAERVYRVVVKHGSGREETIRVENARAVHGTDAERVAGELAGAAVAATAVGPRALPAVIPLIAQGLDARRERGTTLPLDVIIAENMRDAASFFRGRLAASLPDGFPLDKSVGLIETSIGKMVPIVREEDRRRDPLCVFAEPYNRLICDARGFKNPIPDVKGLSPVDNIRAYVDRKLFIHNLGHAAAAYFGFESQPNAVCVYEALEDANVLGATRRAMMQSAAAMRAEYPDEFSRADLKRHVDDLLERFRNHALGDTIYRVGRDLRRKLGKADRLIGAMILARRHGLPSGDIARAVIAATRFRGRDECGELLPEDREFIERELPKGLDCVLRTVSDLDPKDAIEGAVLEEIVRAAA